jgi:hypothetical protein
MILAVFTIYKEKSQNYSLLLSFLLWLYGLNYIFFGQMAQFTIMLLPAKEREKFPSEQREYERVNKCGHKIFPIVYKLNKFKIFARDIYSNFK